MKSNVINEPKDRSGRLALAERDGESRMRERQSRKPNRGYAFAAGVKRAGDNKYLDRPNAPLAANESRLGNKGGATGHDNAGSN